jgi:hypothetical protein
MTPESTEVVLVRLDGRLSVVEETLREMRAEVRGGFAGLQFVGREVYASEQRTAKDYAEETRKIAEGARTVAWATASLVIAGFGLMLALLKAVAG